MSDKECQKCGADETAVYSNSRVAKWACGSWRFEGEPFTQSIECQHAERGKELGHLRAIVDTLVQGITEDDTWADGWCVVCHGHQGHDNQDHGGTDCLMKELADQHDEER